MTHINLTDEEAANIVAETAMEIGDPIAELFAVTFAGRIVAELSKATEKKEKEDKRTAEIIRAGLWTIEIRELPDNKARLIMMFRDHLRVDRVVPNKHEALCCAFNALVS